MPVSKAKEEQQRKKREHLVLLLGLLVAHTSDRMAWLATQAATVGHSNFIGAAVALLDDAHADAARYGRTLAGADHGMDLADMEAGRYAANDQTTYLIGFDEDLSNGRYIAEDGTVNEKAIRQRCNLYGGSLVGTANDAWLKTLDPDTEITWVLDPDETNHCDGCPALARENPWTAGTLPTVPGAGDTPCLAYCKCSLRTEEGLEGFTGGTRHG